MVARGRLSKLIAVVATTAIVAAVGVAAWRAQRPTRSLVAHFASTVGVHEGSDVRVLGVKIGTVTRVAPQGQSVLVEMRYDAHYRIPADARAEIGRAHV